METKLIILLSVIIYLFKILGLLGFLFNILNAKVNPKIRTKYLNPFENSASKQIDARNPSLYFDLIF